VQNYDHQIYEFVPPCTIVAVINHRCVVLCAKVSTVDDAPCDVQAIVGLADIPDNVGEGWGVLEIVGAFLRIVES
jgi:hypothetical protein